MWKFTPNGSLKASAKIKYVRNSKGYIIKKLDYTWDAGNPDTYKYSYNDKKQLIHAEVIGEGASKSDYEYDNRGFVIREYHELCYGGYLTKNIYEYTYTKFDKYGNWISRDYTLNTKEYDYVEDSLLSEETKTGTETREITYYK